MIDEIERLDVEVFVNEVNEDTDLLLLMRNSINKDFEISSKESFLDMLFRMFVKNVFVYKVNANGKLARTDYYFIHEGKVFGYEVLEDWFVEAQNVKVEIKPYKEQYEKVKELVEKAVDWAKEYDIKNFRKSELHQFNYEHQDDFEDLSQMAIDQLHDKIKSRLKEW